MKQAKGITLIALIVTIIVILILASITLNLIFDGNGILKKVEEADEAYKIGQAREKLELALGYAQIEKNVNKEYNENEFLDELIKKEIEDSKIKGDVVIVDGYGFEIDRSVPKIEDYVGKEEELLFPNIELSQEVSSDAKTATIKIKTKEEKNGISKIEIIQEGFVIKEYNYENVKEEIIEEFVVKQNGKYTVKVYSKLTGTESIEINGIIATIKYEPNGSAEYQKEHRTRISIEGEKEDIRNIKYQWLQTTAEPAASTFTQTCNEGETITKNGITGKWYLWTLLETNSGTTNIGRSEAFSFDNQGPTVTLENTPVSATSFTLTARATDAQSGVAKYEFYVNDVLKNTQETTNTSASYTATGVSTGDTSCYVIVTDTLGNTTRQNVTGKTKLYTWEKWSTNVTYTYSEIVTKTQIIRNRFFDNPRLTWCVKFNSNTGCFETPSSYYSNYCQLAYCPMGIYFSPSSFGNYSSACRIKSRKNLGAIPGGDGYPVFEYEVDVLGSESHATYSKGTTQYTNVTSTTSTAYPNNSNSGSYWYVYKGAQ